MELFQKSKIKKSKPIIYLENSNQNNYSKQQKKLTLYANIKDMPVNKTLIVSRNNSKYNLKGGT